MHAHALSYCAIDEPAGVAPLRAPMTLVSRRAESVGPAATFIALVRELNQAGAPAASATG